MKIVLGIGNPGAEYASTRHNVGFMVTDLIAERLSLSGFRRRFDSHVAETRWHGGRVLLLKPQTYVNESGRALRQAVDWYGVEPDAVLVVVDDLNLPLGVVRVRGGGSPGGHNGLESVVAHLQTRDFPRLRVGIGCECRRRDRSFVLSAFDVSERETVAASVVRAADAVELWVREGLEPCMNVYNVRPRENPSEDDDKEENV